MHPTSERTWKNPALTLGQRCVLLARHEMNRGVKAAPYGQPNTSKDVRVYLAPCLRQLDADPELERLGLTAGNWCAAFASWCLEECLLPGETRPHLYRAGVVEIIADAKLSGRWHEVSEVRCGRWLPAVGDLAIWDRSEKGKPETNWWRHVNRVVRYQSTNELLVTIGGNEVRAIRETADAPKRLSDSKLLGFVSYSQQTQKPQDRGLGTEDMNLVAAFVEAHRKDLLA